MREKLVLEELPDAVRHGILATSSVPAFQLNAIEKGSWSDMEGHDMESKVDIFFYEGRYWQHEKCRMMGMGIWPAWWDCPVLVEVFPKTKEIVAYE